MKKSYVITAFIALVGATLIYQALSLSKKSEASGSGALQAPTVTFTNLKGKDFHLSDYKGKVIVINFWATWCPPCRAEFPSMLEMADYFSGKLVLITVSQDNNADIIKSFLNKFQDKHSDLLNGSSFQAVWDMGHQISGRTFGVHRFPESFVIDKKGFIVRKIPGAIDWMNTSSIAYFDSLIKK